MARFEHSVPQPECRELLQLAFEGVACPAVSLEHLLDRLSHPAGPTSEGTRDKGMNEGTWK